MISQWPARVIVNSRGRPCRGYACLALGRKEGRKTNKEPVMNLQISRPIDVLFGMKVDSARLFVKNLSGPISSKRVLECYVHQKRCNIFESVRMKKCCLRFWCAYHSLRTFLPIATSLRNQPKITLQIHEKSA